MNIVDLLIEFRITQNKEILGNVDWIEQENLNVIAIEILSWLKLERKRELWIEEGIHELRRLAYEKYNPQLIVN